MDENVDKNTDLQWQAFATLIRLRQITSLEFVEQVRFARAQGLLSHILDGDLESARESLSRLVGSLYHQIDPHRYPAGHVHDVGSDWRLV